jgi:hypothetical protein
LYKVQRDRHPDTSCYQQTDHLQSRVTTV